jgi:hypothetical protein
MLGSTLSTYSFKTQSVVTSHYPSTSSESTSAALGHQCCTRHGMSLTMKSSRISTLSQTTIASLDCSVDCFFSALP